MSVIIDTRGVTGGKLDDANRGLESLPNNFIATQAKDATRVNNEGNSNKYSELAIKLVTELKRLRTKYGHQTVIKGKAIERELDFLINDTFCDCSKFVLKVMLRAYSITFTSTYIGMNVPGFGNEQVSEVSSVSGMIKKIEALVKANQSKSIRFIEPLVGDLMFWGEHVAIVTGLGNLPNDISITFANMGRSGPSIRGPVPLQTRKNNIITDTIYGSGGFKGFWTPVM